MLTEAIAADVKHYYHLSRAVKRWAIKGHIPPPYMHNSYIECKNRLHDLYKITGLNFITICDEDIAHEWLSCETVIAVAFIPNKNICCLQRFAFTVAIVCDCNMSGYEGRYCYHTLAEAREAFNTWDGNGHPPGNWIKAKGFGEDIINPNYIKRSSYSS